MLGTGSQKPLLDLEALIDEVRLLWHALVERSERLHADEAITLGMRAVLEQLERRGAMTVPQIARARGVSRQHIQGLVNGAMEAGCVTLEDNPAHLRSGLVQLSSEGARTIARMRRREAAFFKALGLDLAPAQLRRAASTLRALRQALTGRESSNA